MSINSRKFIIEFNNKLENAKNPFLDEADDVEIEETKPSRFLQHLDKTENSFSNISAERSKDNSPFKDDDTDTGNESHRLWNKNRTKELKDMLKSMGLKGYFKTKGGFAEIGQAPDPDYEENSFFIPNITKEQAIELGKHFDQDSILFKEKGSNQAKYIYTNTSNGHTIGDVDGDLIFNLGQGRYNIKSGEFYTRLPKSPAKFSYSTDDNYDKSDTFHKGKGSIKNIK